MRDEEGQSKGFGFVCFSTSDEARKAMAEMNDSIIDSKAIYVNFAQRKEERRMQLKQHYMQRMPTQRIAPQVAMPFPTPMSTMMPYLVIPMNGSQQRAYFQQAPNPAAFRPLPRWSGPTTAGTMQSRPSKNRKR